MSCRLIINADDAGISRCVNDAITTAARAGRITAASVMATMPFAAEAVECFARDTPTLELGLHFCLTSGRPCGPPNERSQLVNASGRFAHGFVGLWRRATSSQRETFLAQVASELASQLDFCDRHNVPLRFIDGHQHVHIIPGIIDCMHREAVRRGLGVRIPDEPFGGVARWWRRGRHWLGSSLVKKALLSFLSRRAERRLGLSTSQHARPVYYGVLDTGQMSLAAWEAILRSPQTDGKTVLVNVHPATTSASGLTPSDLDASPDDHRFLLSPHRVMEYDTLMSPAWERLCIETGAVVSRWSESQKSQ